MRPSSVLVDERDQTGIRCPECQTESFHPMDVEQGYCGRCEWWTSVPHLWLPWAVKRRAAEAGPWPVTPPVRCKREACAELTVCQTNVEARVVGDGGLTFWWCPGCFWSGLAHGPHRFGLCCDPDLSGADMIRGEGAP